MQLKLRLQGLPELLQQQLGQYHLVHNHNPGHPEKDSNILIHGYFKTNY